MSPDHSNLPEPERGDGTSPAQGKPDLPLPTHVVGIGASAGGLDRDSHTKRVLLAIRNVNQLIVRESDPEALLAAVCATLTETLGYTRAWGALLPEGSVRPEVLAQAGFGEDFAPLAEALQEGRLPTCVVAALHEPGPHVLLERLRDCPECPISRAYGESIVLLGRLEHGNRVHGVLSVTFPAGISPDAEGLDLFHELTGDLGFALSKLEEGAALAEAQRRYRELFERSRDGFVFMDSSGRIVDANPAYRALLGYSLEELRRMGHFREITPERWHRWEEEEIWRKGLLQEGRSGLYEKEYRRKDGTIVPVEIEAFAVPGKGRHLDIWGVVRGIEERLAAEEATRRAQEESRAAQALSRALFNALPVPAFTKDREGRYLECNESFARLSGLNREEIRGKTVFELWSPDRAQVYHQMDLALMASGSRQEYEGKIPSVEGEPRDVLFVKDVLRDGDGEVAGIVGVYVDVTEKKLAEQALRLQAEEHQALLATSLDGYWLSDEAGRLLEVNEAYCRMSGYSRSELLGLSIGDLDAMESPAEVRRRIDRLILKGSGRRETRHRARDGRLFDVEVSATHWAGGKRILAFLRDITDRNRRRRELEESEERFRTLLDAAPMGVLVVQEGRYVFCNPEGARMLGYDSPRELTGVAIEDTIAPEHQPQVRSRMAAAAHGNRNPPVELCLRHRDGTPVWSWSTSVPIVLNGSPAILIAGQDTTELKRAERALKEATLRQQTAMQAGQVGLWDWDLTTNKVWFSPEWKRQIGHGEDEVGNDFWEWETRVHPEDLPETQARIEGFLAGTTADYQVEFRFRHKDGSWRWMLARASIVRDEEGTPVRALGTHVDITDRKRAELERERLLQAIEQAGEGFVITDTIPTIQYVNPAFERVTGYSREEVLGQNPRILKSGEHDSDFYQRMWDTLGRGETWHGHMINRRKDGTLFTEEASISPVHDRMGEVVNYVAVKRDVSRELRLEAEREELEAQFQQAQKLESIGRLAGGVAHDLNNLLSPILGYGELLVEDLDAKDSRRTSAEAIVEAGERARELVLQLLTFSRKQVLEFKVFDPNEMLSRFERLLRRTITEDVSLELKLEEGVPPIRGDVGKLEQVIMNLAVNAQDAMPGGGRLVIETGAEELDEEGARVRGGSSPGSFCRIRVRDTGTGMSEDTLSHLFEPFFTTKARGKGTGLGLSTVYGIVKQHGGLLTVDSSPGVGTTFEILLPAMREGASQPLPEGRSSGPQQGSETILLVEDHDAVRSLAAAILRRHGYQVLSAAHGREALALMEEHEGPLDLVLTDVVMPEMNGKELHDAVAALRPGVKALFMSGYTDDVIVHRGVLMEGINFLPKPFSVKSLTLKVREVLDRKTEAG